MKLKILCLAVVFLLGSNSFLFGQEKNVTVTTLVDFAPYCYKKGDTVEKLKEVIPPGSDSSQLQGYSWDVVRESFHEMGYTITLLIAPWARAMSYTKKGKADVIFPAIKTKEREKIFYYSKEAVDETNIVVYFPENSKLDMKNGFDSLNGIRIGTVRGWAYGKKWEANQGIIKEPTDTVIQGFQMLDRNRVSGVVGYENAFDHKLKTEGILNKYSKSAAVDHVADYLIGKKDDAKIVNIVKDFDKGKKKIILNGEFDKINKTWKWVDSSQN